MAKKNYFKSLNRETFFPHIYRPKYLFFAYSAYRKRVPHSHFHFHFSLKNIGNDDFSSPDVQRFLSHDFFALLARKERKKGLLVARRRRKKGVLLSCHRRRHKIKKLRRVVKEKEEEKEDARSIVKRK